jgi:farnesyl-diphosphate farnesyltransferase
MADARAPLLTDLLRQVSRSFYLTLRVLPRAVRPPIGLAYLLARTADTVADTGLLPVEQRLNALGQFRERLRGRTTAPLNWTPLTNAQGTPAEQTLLARVEDSLALLATLPAEDAELVRHVLDIILTGQELDLLRFREASAARLVALETDADLDDYTYRVAGCVGEFWTRLCCRRLFRAGEVNEPQLLADGVRFGRGLQLVNILRDVPADARMGRCYIPRARLAAAGLQPEDLLKPESEPAFRPVYDELLNQAEAHLRAGWNYTNALPANQWRLRLACAWPVLLGAGTLERLRTGPVLAAARPVKISRPEVRSTLWRSVVRVPFPRAFRRLWSAPGVEAGSGTGSPPASDTTPPRQPEG